MQNKPNLRSKQIGRDRDDFELDVQPIPVRVHVSKKEYMTNYATIAMITVIATVVGTVAGNMLFSLL